jgi:hypothetical protein
MTNIGIEIRKKVKNNRIDLHINICSVKNSLNEKEWVYHLKEFNNGHANFRIFSDIDPLNFDDYFNTFIK